MLPLRRLLRLDVAFLATLALLAGLALLPLTRGPVSPVVSLASGLEPLRDAFDAETGEVRAVLLATPT